MTAGAAAEGFFLQTAWLRVVPKLHRTGSFTVDPLVHFVYKAQVRLHLCGPDAPYGCAHRDSEPEGALARRLHNETHAAKAAGIQARPGTDHPSDP